MKNRKILRSDRKIHKTCKPVLNLAVVHAEAELIHIGLHVLDRHMVVDSIYTPLDDCPKRLNAVGVLSVTLGKLNLMVDHDTDEILRVLFPSLIDDIVAAILVSHNRSAFLASIVQHLQELLSRQFRTIGILGSHHTMHPSATPFLDTDNGSLER